MSNLLELAAQIGNLRKAVAGIQIELAHRDEDERGRKAYIIANTDAATLGKTDADRKRGFEVIFDADEALKATGAKQSELRDRLARTLAEAEALELQFKAERWNIRRELAAALSGRTLEETGAADPDFDTGLDDVSDERAEARAAGAVLDNQFTPAPALLTPADEEPLPF